ncbi:FecR family protein [uncultured Mucilaginibacter sp.]|uniref:FecR family protein n=1 Tax=uncultured Mucilaginibacter sp. TaxID=797541 RepID=UPI0025FC4E12|nr:FecR family protein [uncultured Mucilaginibacter sp.]
MKRQDYNALYKKYLAGKCTPEEWELLNAFEDEPGLEDIAWDAELGDEEEAENRIFSKITEGVTEKLPVKTIRFGWLYIAASFLLLATAMGVYVLNTRHKKQQLAVNKVKPVKNDILPGGNKAILTLSNGSTIVLNSAKDGVITKEGGAAVNKTQNGQLVYQANDEQNGAATAAPIVYNTVTTPRGGEYQIVLADGTKAWLNAASSLKFPTAFTGNTRQVEITGEVYFEVAKNKDKPFIVTSNGAEVEVLGTHFDVMAYNDEPVIKTTLLEGSVKFRKNKAEVLLSPGEQAVSAYASGNIKVQKANIGETMAWRDGYFVFQDENIQGIMRKVSRWYNVEVVYKGNMEDKEYGGKISRYKNISDVLKSLELTGTIHFKVEERRVTVMQ